MKCEECMNLLNEYADGELSPEKTAEVEEHLNGCEKCRTYIDQICAIKMEMAEMSEPVPEELHSRIMKAVKAERARKVVKIPFYRKKSFGMAIAACFLIAVIAVFAPSFENNMQEKGIGSEISYQSSDNSEARSPDGSATMDTAPMDEASDNYQEPDLPDSSDSEDITEKTRYIFSGVTTLPEEITSYSLQYVDGEVYIICETAEQIAEVVKLLDSAEFSESQTDILSDKGIGVYNQYDKVVIVVLE